MLRTGHDPHRLRDTGPVPETLTASFCERCGSRHEFRAPTGLGPLRKTRGFLGGLRTYLVSEEGLSDAMRDAMQVEESAVAAKQLEAFHASIHLCLGCRQYTCNDCWNVTAGKCRTCAPLPGVDDLADRIAASLAPGAMPLGEPAAVPVFEHAEASPLPAESWPQADHEVYAATAAEAEAPGYALAVVPPEPTFADEEPPVIESEVATDDAVAADAGEAAAPDSIAAAAFDERWPEEAVADADAPDATREAPEPVAAAERPRLHVVAWDEDAAPAAASDADHAAPDAVEPAAWAGSESTAAEAPAADADDDRLAAMHDLDAEPFIADRTSWLEQAQREEPRATEDEAAEPAAARSDADLEPTPIAAAFGYEPPPVAFDADPDTGFEDVTPAAAVREEAEAPAAEAPPAEPAAPQPPPAPRRSGPMRDRIVRRGDQPRRPRRGRRVAAEAGADEVAARRAQLEELGLSAAAEAPDQAAADAQILPYRSRGAPPSNRDATLAAIRQGSLVWEASAREVDAGGVTVQSCGECGLALSASARFCRRCGTRQAQPA